MVEWRRRGAFPFRGSVSKGAERGGFLHPASTTAGVCDFRLSQRVHASTANLLVAGDLPLDAVIRDLPFLGVGHGDGHRFFLRLAIRDLDRLVERRRTDDRLEDGDTVQHFFGGDRVRAFAVDRRRETFELGRRAR